MDSLQWGYPGSRWWKFEFHTHTPASEDYGKGAQQNCLRKITPKEWLLNYMRAGIDCIAITDHNSGVWIDHLKDALKELESEEPDCYRPIYLFPGVEISVHGGVHLIAILDPSCTTSVIDSLLGAVGLNRLDGVTTKSFIQVVEAINKYDGIAIPAHVDDKNGLFTNYEGDTLTQVLRCGNIFAMEVVRSSFQKPQLYHDMRLSWTEVLGSDAHHPNGTNEQRFPGSHFTWVKMGTPNLEGLRLALLDGPLSVRRSDDYSEDPNRHADLVIKTIEINKVRYMGRSSTFKVEFNPWLNAIIGGRGTGKSTLIEFIRLALRRDSELPETLINDFEKYRDVYRSRDDDGLLTDESRFTVTYRKDRTNFRIHWSCQGDVDPIEVQDESGNWRSDHGEVAERFPVRIYSQKQIFELAKAPLALLRIVDEAREVDRRSLDERWKEEQARFFLLRAKAREIKAGLADEARLLGELDDIKRKLAIFEEAGHADVLREYQKRLRQQHEIEGWENAWSHFGNRLRALARELVPDTMDASLFETDSETDKDILEKAKSTIEQLRGLCSRLENLARETDGVFKQWCQVRDESLWKQAVILAINNYDKLRQRLKDAAESDPSAYGELVKRRQALEARLKEVEFRRAELENVSQQSDECLEQLKELRRQLTRRRIEFLRNILKDNPYIRIEVIPYGASEMAETEFRNILQRKEGFDRDIGGLLDSLYNNNGNSTFEQRLQEIKRKIYLIATGEKHKCDVFDQRFVTHIVKLPPEAFDRLDSWFPEDSLHVKYSTTADGNNFRSIQEGSPGQKTAALLAFLFSYGDEPLILDQPEDDLDNNLIYKLIVKQLRRIKQKRQVIVVSHNANIVVNGDSELVVALTARNGQTQKVCAGCLQEKIVRDTICEVMEGGPEAFELRWKRLGGDI